MARAKRIGYGINYRDMHTAIHGIIFSKDKRTIFIVDDICAELEDAEDEYHYNALLDELDSYDIEVIEEINYRDITSDNKYYLDDGYIDIINPVSYDLYL